MKNKWKAISIISLDIFSQKHGIFCIFWGDCTRRAKEWGAFDDFCETHLYVCRQQSDQTGKTYNKGIFLIDAVETHVCMRNLVGLVWYTNNFNVFCYTILIFHRRVNSTCTQQRRWRRSENNGDTFFNI